MASGLGFCPSCGTAREKRAQKFCAVCGAALPPLAAEAPAPAEPAAPTGGAPERTAQAAEAVPPPPPPAPAPTGPAWGQPAYQTPPQPAGRKANSAGLLIAALAIIAVVAGGIFVVANQKQSPGSTASPGESASAATSLPAPTPTPGKPGTGSVAFEPASFGCSDTGSATMTMSLPDSVDAGVTVMMETDGSPTGSSDLVGNIFTQQSDGSWQASDTQTIASLCDEFDPGHHTIRIVDSDGNVLAAGTFTIAATATPGPGGGGIVVQPPIFSCSSSTQVTLSVVLPTSVGGDDMVTPEIDGQADVEQWVAANFELLPDGTWLSEDVVAASDICANVGVGQHTLRVLDADGSVLAIGTFTANP
jgi:hypothetical protein